MTLTLTLKRNDEQGFQRYLRDVYDPSSTHYRQFSTQTALTTQFGPSRGAYREVLNYLRASRLRLVAGSKNRLTLTVRGTRADVEQALRIGVHDYRMGGTSFYANDRDPALPAALAARIMGVSGLSSLSAPRPVIKSWAYQSACHAGAAGQNGGDKAKKQCVDFVNAKYGVYRSVVCGLPAIGVFAKASPVAAGLAAGGVIWVWLACALTDMASSLNALSVSGGYTAQQVPSSSRAKILSTGAALQPVEGAGQTIGLVEFDGFNTADVSDYLAFIGAPPSLINNLSTKAVNGGVASPGSSETEVLLDIDTVMTLAPAAKVVAYEAPFDGKATSYTTVFNAMINDGVTVISNSWASCEDQVSLAEAQSIDAVLQAAAASGISVFNGTGDSGSTCLDGSPNTISVPADSPSATAVGGTSWPQDLGPGRTYNTETWWDGTNSVPPTGQGGFGVSRYFVKPGYQSAVSSASMRSIPDVAVRADPANGVVICQADAGGCPSGTLNGGTSLAAPEWAAIAAQLNEKAGRKLGALNPQMYALSATAAFHSAASMGSDFQHVGLGSPNINVLGRLLSGQTSVGLPDAGASRVLPLFQPGTATLKADGTFPVPADGTSTGGVLVVLYDANGNTVSGKTVTLTSSGGSAIITPASGVSTVENGAVVFSLTDLNPETLTLTATDTTDGVAMAPVTVTFGVPSAASAGISANPPTVAADGQSAATITVTMTDSLNRPTPGKIVTIASGSHAVLSGPSQGVTDANGQIQFLATDQVNESVTFSAVDVTDDNLAIPGSATVTYSGSVSTACGVGVVPTPGAGYTITPYVTGLPAAPTIFYGNINIGCPGADNPVFLSSGQVLVGDFLTGGLYETGLSGGAVSSTNRIATLTPTLTNFTIGKDVCTPVKAAPALKSSSWIRRREPSCAPWLPDSRAQRD
jgi:subtilase family serine protease